MQRNAPIAVLIFLIQVGCTTGERLNSSNRSLQATPLSLDFGPREAGS